MSKYTSVLSPPRERPNACSNGSPGPLFSHSGCVADCFVVNQPQLRVDARLAMRSITQSLGNPLQRPVPAQLVESVLHRLPGTIALRHVSQRGARTQRPEHAIEKLPVVSFWTAHLPRRLHQVPDPLAVPIFQLVMFRRGPSRMRFCPSLRTDRGKVAQSFQQVPECSVTADALLNSLCWACLMSLQ